MRKVISLSTIAVLCLLPFAARADVKMAPDFSRPDSFVTARKMAVTQTLTLGGVATDTKIESMAQQRFTQGKRDAEGNFLLTLEQVSQDIHMQLPQGMTIDVDSANGTAETNTPLLQFIVDALKALDQLTVKLAVSPEGKVLSAKAESPTLDNLSAEAKRVIASQLSEASLKRSVQQQFELLPGRVVKPGDFWKAQIDLDLGQGQLLTFTQQCEYVGPVDVSGKTLHRVNIKDTDVKFSLAENSELPLKLADSDLSIEESGGELLFDADAGRVVSVKARTRITGDINFTINDQPLPGKLDLTFDTQSNDVPNATK
ncbi:MAG: hypothetical protein KDA63_00725 [Planctomycetales bacterium]|nr:hypothetical protein [Planctomycetales bacterium]